MQFELSWLIEKRVILARVSGVVDLYGMQRYLDARGELLAQGEPPVHIITDAAQVVGFPKDVRQMSRLISQTGVPSGWIVTFGMKSFLVPQVNLVARITHSPFHFANDLAETLRFLKSKDPSLLA